MDKVIVNGKDISSLVFSFQIYEEMDKEHLIGNAVSTQIKLTLRNKDNQLKDLLDYPFIIGNKSYIVYAKPEKYTNMISVTLYDNMLLTNVRYESKLEYPTTISKQLDEISQLLGSEDGGFILGVSKLGEGVLGGSSSSGMVIDKSTLSEEVLEKEVSWYDNTMPIRNYLSFIAQIDGKNAFIVDDVMVFRPLATNQHSTNFSSDYELNEQLQFTRVVYDDGIQFLSRGDESGKTLYLSPNNSYVTQEDVDRVYEMYQGLSFYSFKKFKCYGIDDLMLTDLVSYHDFTILPLSIKRTVNGGVARDSLELTGDIVIKNVESVIVKNDISVRIKRIQTIVDQNAAKMNIIAQDVEDNEGRITELELSSEKINLSVQQTTSKVEKLESQVTVTNVASQYGVSTNKTTEPTEWKDSRPTVISGQYLWMREKYTYSDNTIKYDGVRMVSAEDGKDGTEIVFEYALSSSSTIPPNNGKGKLGRPSIYIDGMDEVKKLATPTIYLSDSDTNTSAVLGEAILGQMILGSGPSSNLTRSATVLALEKLDTPVIRLEDVQGKLETPVIRIADDSEQIITSEWSTTPPQRAEGQYIWQRVKYIYADGSISYSEPVCITGADGINGEDGYTPIKGVDYFDGKDGIDGYTPVKGLDYFDGENGKDGKDGNDGYTPIKGVDYFDGKDGANGKDAITYRIDSSLGVAFLDGQNEITVLTARIYKGSSELDVSGTYGYTWYLVDKDGTERVIGNNKTLSISTSTIADKGIYFVADDGGATEEITKLDTPSIYLQDITEQLNTPYIYIEEV